MTRDSYFGATEQRKAARHRMDDARALLNAVRWRGSMYMAGYAIECLLKYKLMQIFECRHLRELEAELHRRGVLPEQKTVFTHQLETLMSLANGLDRLRRSEEHWRLFNMVNRWIPAWRYSADLSSREDAEDFLAAIETIARWIENNV